MTQPEIRTMKIFNPFSDEYEELICTFDMNLSKHFKLDKALVTSIVSEGGIELCDYLSQEKQDGISQDFMDEWESEQ